ncbi:thioesterase superfamily protein [Thermaerobacter marianensis DSM 12885]|uniref:Thioesterase superfamily protein n=1 Tax=Thermaerobacter marianensis (strain ATCC 700841 / DSM 12885 / JCM 10246 / 7p75a) TaxID=644966 RepID=E6SHJ6_THEM7|nr:PaaI family thioesterase [Thermaerobacter marianensis]ADU51791.1 thioesterase superfamily protein [Thermaerobacter marianensis DSM 12885]
MSDFLALGRAVLAQQSFSVLLGTELLEFEPGRAVLALQVKDAFRQQHGFVHGGVISYLVDNALTFAGGSVLGENVLTVEFKVNYLRPARGERLIARATAESSGRRIAVCRCDVVSVEGGQEQRCAIGQGTIALAG